MVCVRSEFMSVCARLEVSVCRGYNLRHIEVNIEDTHSNSILTDNTMPQPVELMKHHSAYHIQPKLISFLIDVIATVWNS